MSFFANNVRERFMIHRRRHKTSREGASSGGPSGHYLFFVHRAGWESPARFFTCAVFGLVSHKKRKKVIGMRNRA